VRSIVEKPREAETDIVNTGIYSFSKSIFDYIEAELDIPEVINNMIEQGNNVNFQETGGTWFDVVYPWDILSLNNEILRTIPPSLGGTIEAGATVKGPVSIGKDTVVRANSYIAGPAVIGANCDVGPNVVIMPATSIGDNVVISPFTEIENSVISNDVNIGPGSIIQDSVIDESCFIGGHFTACSEVVEIRVDDGNYSVNVGAMLGVGCNLGNGVVAQPGVIVGNYTRVQAMKLIHGNLPDKSSVY